MELRAGPGLLRDLKDFLPEREEGILALPDLEQKPLPSASFQGALGCPTSGQQELLEPSCQNFSLEKCGFLESGPWKAQILLLQLLGLLLPTLDGLPAQTCLCSPASGLGI